MHKLDFVAILLVSCCAIVAIRGQQQEQQQQQQQQPPAQPSPSLSNSSALSPSPSPSQQQQQQQQQSLSNQPSLQNQLNAIQVQAQRQLGQLNGLVMNAVNSTKYSNVLEAISNVGKVIHQQISAAAANNPNNVNIITAPTTNLRSGAGVGESANNKKNEYQSIVVTDQGSSLVDSNGGSSALGGANQPLGLNGQPMSMMNYREQGEILRLDIVRRVGQLQQVVTSSMDLLKNNGDLIVRRLLEQMNVRLDQAKAKADRIISEPATNEVALRALSTINLGLNNLNNIISNIVNRLEAANKENNQYQMSGSSSSGASSSNMISQRQQGGSSSLASGNPLPPLLDSNRIRMNLHQLSQQFQSALNGSQLQQQLAALRQRQQQQMALLQLPGANRQATVASSNGLSGVGAQNPAGQSPSIGANAPPAAPTSVAVNNKINTDFNKSQ